MGLRPVLPLRFRMSLGPTLEETMGSVGPGLQVFEVLELTLLPLRRGCPLAVGSIHPGCGVVGQRERGWGPRASETASEASVLAARPRHPTHVAVPEPLL